MGNECAQSGLLLKLTCVSIAFSNSLSHFVLYQVTHHEYQNQLQSPLCILYQFNRCNLSFTLFRILAEQRLDLFRSSLYQIK